MAKKSNLDSRYYENQATPAGMERFRKQHGLRTIRQGYRNCLGNRCGGKRFFSKDLAAIKMCNTCREISE